MLLGLGSFRFTVPNFSVERLSLQTSSRVAQQDIIGAVPSVHLLGPGGSEVSLDSTFHPRHFNKGGPAMIAAMRAAQAAQNPLNFFSVAGDVFGKWVITGIDTDSSAFDPGGRAQTIQASISLVKMPAFGRSGALGLFA